MGETAVFVSVVSVETVRTVLEGVLAPGKTKVVRQAAPVLTLCLFCSCLVTPSTLACT